MLGRIGSTNDERRARRGEGEREKETRKKEERRREKRRERRGQRPAVAPNLLLESLSYPGLYIWFKVETRKQVSD